MDKGHAEPVSVEIPSPIMKNGQPAKTVEEFLADRAGWSFAAHWGADKDNPDVNFIPLGFSKGMVPVELQADPNAYGPGKGGFAFRLIDKQGRIVIAELPSEFIEQALVRSMLGNVMRDIIERSGSNEEPTEVQP